MSSLKSAEEVLAFSARSVSIAIIPAYYIIIHIPNVYKRATEDFSIKKAPPD
jgi:hypothetical protein